MTDPVLGHLMMEREQTIARLMDYVRLPSVSADPAYADGMEAARTFLMNRLKALGFTDIRLLGDGKRPAVYTEWLGAPGKPVFLVYGHYDVQPPDPLDKWTTPPFEPDIRNARLYGRGASDDKGPSLLALETLGAFLTTEGALPVNVKVLLEGEEEVGSAGLPDILEINRDLLAADAVISADGGRWRADLATINVASRGNAGFEFKVETAVKDLHSGRFGGAVPNALHVMAGLIASLHRPDGGIAVDGFLDGVTEPTNTERAMMADIPFDENGFFADLGTEPLGEAGYTTIERLWVRPTLEVNGMWGGYQGGGSKTVIPNEAFAKLTMRLVPGQDPLAVMGAVETHLTAHCPAGAKVSILDKRGWCGAYAVPEAHPLLLAAEDAVEATLGARPLRVRMGATLPLTDIVSSVLGIDTVMFSFATSDEDYHAPNEFFRLESLDQGFAAWTRLIRSLGEHDTTRYGAYRQR